MAFKPAYLTPIVRKWGLRVLLLVIGSGLGWNTGHAQTSSRPLIDGLTISPGLTIYVGDLDGNPNGNLIQYFASARFGFMIAADRRFGKTIGGLELHYDHFKVDRGAFEFSNNIFSLDLIGGYYLNLIQPDFFRLSGGVGFTLLAPNYTRLPEDIEGVRRLGTRPVITFPVSLSIQDRIRVGIRFTLTDFLDSFRGDFRAGPFDLISFVRIGYRFDFVN